MDERVGQAVDGFVAALGSMAEPEVTALAQTLPDTIGFDDLGVLVQGHRRDGMRSRAVLVSIVAGELRIAGPDGPPVRRAAVQCTASARPGRLAGHTLELTMGDERHQVRRAMPIDEVQRLVGLLSGAGVAISAHPPLARLGPAALYADRITIDDGLIHPLDRTVRARAHALPVTTQSLRRLLGDDPGPPRQVLIDGPGWSHAVPAPPRAPHEADRFAAAINRAVAGRADDLSP